MCVCEYWSSPHRHPCLTWCALTQNQALCGKSVHTLFGIGWTQDWGIQGNCDKDVCAIFYPLLEVTSLKKKLVCVKDSSAEGTCPPDKCYSKDSYVNFNNIEWVYTYLGVSCMDVKDVNSSCIVLFWYIP